MQTETMVSARSSAHLSHPAVDPFSRELDLADLLSIVPAATESTSPKTVSLTAEPEREPAPKSLNGLFTTYLQYERDIRNLFNEQSNREKLLFGPDWSPRVEAPSTQGIFRIASSP